MTAARRIKRTGVRMRVAWWEHPRWFLAAKTAVAAGLAWLAVQPLGGFTAAYPYYGPLGAVVATSTTVVSSVRSSVQAVAAILLGSGTALLIRSMSLPTPAAIATAIAVAVLVGGWRPLGAMRSWTPFAALFVLILGGSHPIHYVLAYGGLTGMGACIGTGVNLLLPQLPLSVVAKALARLRADLARQLDCLADGLAAESVLTHHEWQELCLTLDPQVRRLDDLVSEAMEARRANWRARRWQEAADRRYDEARALHQLTTCIDELVALVSDDTTVVHRDGELPGALRSATAQAMHEVAALLRSDPTDPTLGACEDPDAAAHQAAAAVEQMRAVIHRLALDSVDDYLPAAAIAMNLERVRRGLAPRRGGHVGA